MCPAINIWVSCYRSTTKGKGIDRPRNVRCILYYTDRLVLFLLASYMLFSWRVSVFWKSLHEHFFIIQTWFPAKLLIPKVDIKYSICGNAYCIWMRCCVTKISRIHYRVLRVQCIHINSTIFWLFQIRWCSMAMHSLLYIPPRPAWYTISSCTVAYFQIFFVGEKV